MTDDPRNLRDYGHPIVKVHGWSGDLSLSHIQKLAHVERKDDTTDD